MRCPDPELHKPEAQPIHQLLYAALHARKALDLVDQAITRHIEPLRQQAAITGEPDPLFFTPIGRQLTQDQFNAREQLARIAKQYIALGIEERQLQVFEDWSNLLVPLLTQLLDDPDLHMTRRQRLQAPAVIQRHIAALEHPLGSSHLNGMIDPQHTPTD
jgi:hypothetical protein